MTSGPSHERTLCWFWLLLQEGPLSIRDEGPEDGLVSPPDPVA